jgi:hypothetical protein
MSPSTTTAPAVPVRASTAPVAEVRSATPKTSRRLRTRIRQASCYVALLVWGVPLAAFVVSAVHADATPCPAVGDLPCDGQGVVVVTAVLAATLLIPLGLLAMVVVAVLASTLPSRPPTVLAVAASASVAALAATVWGIFSLVTS